MSFQCNFWVVFENCFLWISGRFDYFSSTPNWSYIHLPFSAVFKVERKRNWNELLTRKEVEDAVRATSRFISELKYFPFFPFWLKRCKKRFNFHDEYFKIIESYVDEQIFRFRFGRGGANDLWTAIGLFHTIISMSEQLNRRTWILWCSIYTSRTSFGGQITEDN